MQEDAYNSPGEATYYYPVIGRKNTGIVADRLLITDMQKNYPYQFSLFILGYSAIQGVRNTSLGIALPDNGLPAASFFEIAAIHGKPYREYVGDKKSPKERVADYDENNPKDTLPTPSRFGGYCNHGSVTFPTWHRPYMLLIEQAMGNAADRIAANIEKQYPAEIGKWVPEAQKLRFPFWDWADPATNPQGLPAVLYEDTVVITLPGGKSATVQNPISYYTFQGGIPSDFTDIYNAPTNTTAYFSKWTRTYRHAPSSPQGGTDIAAAQTAIESQASHLSSGIGLLFAFPDGMDPAIAYDEFSNAVTESKRQEDFNNTGALEALHGIIHGTIGGNGHMTNPDYAAFDPIFFFHHCNVDRLIALWEWCYPSYWMGDGYVHDGVSYSWTQPRGTFAQVYNEQLLPTGARGNLYPFRNDNGTYWTSEQTRFLDANAYPKYYSYPEFQGVKVDQTATDAERAAGRARIAKYYGFDPQQAATQVDIEAWSHLPVPSPQSAGLPETFQAIKSYRVFVVLVQLPEHAFNASYQFELHKNSGNQTDLVGTVTVFARPDYSPCTACALRREMGTTVRGIITLPPSLVNDIIVKQRCRRWQRNSRNDDRGNCAELDGKAVGYIAHVSPPNILPSGVTLFSAAVAEKADDKTYPVQLYDWQKHNALFTNGWKDQTKQSTPASSGVLTSLLGWLQGRG
ncbi:common central domain of tyrosinase-domain-containing protein [Pisolithus orientalis]|uniref:common central domain of tyrosinase-domain-containing protein n=1 Tax=Pisolithus orientalis TaxID=936130 RepID=UPI0022248178|nr:common central domain of tyrosinase-domain-containing protein [Pisolithus orientalis]KAI6004478.1 common central domain of tyrosinase-domain-containing protein [Pisolithus orientalis]